MKLMLVGAAERGKTTLLQCIRSGTVTSRKSHRRPPVLSTLGVQVSQWRYTHRPGVEYKLSCWDFAGQEDFYATHQCFLTPRSVYLLVYDMSRGDKELPSIVSWLLNIHARAPQSPVIVVGTHRDLIPKGGGCVHSNIRCCAVLVPLYNRPLVLRASLSADGFFPRQNEIRTKIRKFTCKPGFPRHVHLMEVSCHRGNLGLKELIDKIKEVVDG